MRAAYFSRQLPEHQRLRLSIGKRAGLWYQVRGFKPGRSRRIFRAKKSSARLPSEGKPSGTCRNLWHVKEPKSDVEVATFGKILGNFSPIDPPSATGVRSCRFKTLGTPCGESWSSKLGGFDVLLATAVCKNLPAENTQL